jgi:gas vesicle protein
MGEDPSKIREQIEHTRAEMGDTVEALAYKADVKSRAKDAVSDKVEAVKSKVTGTAEQVNEATPGTEDVKRTMRKTAGVAQRNPLGLAFGAVAVGFLAGMLVPATSIENQKIGPLADDLKEKAKETGQEVLEHGKQVAQDVGESAKEAAQESGRQHAEELKESATQSGGEPSSSEAPNPVGSTG